MAVMVQHHMKVPQIWLDKVQDFSNRSGLSKPEIIRTSVIRYMEQNQHLLEPVTPTNPTNTGVQG